MYLVIKNSEKEGPGSIAEMLETEEIMASEVKEWKTYEGIIIMGGPMGVYQRQRFPFLQKEIEIIREAVRIRKRVLGICLGAQLISYALGGRVARGSFGPEIGFKKVVFTGGLSHIGVSDVFELHNDAFSLPRGSELLAYSDKYYQAFRMGKALGIQFHPEVTDEMLKLWGFRERADFRKLNKLILDYWLSL